MVVRIRWGNIVGYFFREDLSIVGIFCQEEDFRFHLFCGDGKLSGCGELGDGE